MACAERSADLLDILAITFPIFAVVAFGYGMVRGGLFSSEDNAALGRFAMNVALPALMFSAASGGGTGEGAIINLSYMATYALAGILTIAAAWIWFKLNLTGADTGPVRQAIAVMGSSCPNSAYVGFPVLMLAVPEIAAPAFAMNVMVESFLIVPLSFVILSGAARTKGQPVGQTIMQTAWDVLRRPMVLAFLAGVVVSLLGIPVPEPVSRLVTMLAAATAGLALFFIGGSLTGLPLKGNKRMATEIVIAKLVIHPLMAALALSLIAFFALPTLTGPLAVAVILSAAMPMIGVYAIFAQDYGHENLAALAMMGATVGAFFTISGLLVFLL